MSSGPWKRPQAGRGYCRRAEMKAAKPITVAKPNAMPWITKAMLTGARAPIAKVRS